MGTADQPAARLFDDDGTIAWTSESAAFMDVSISHSVQGCTNDSYSWDNGYVS